MRLTVGVGVVAAFITLAQLWMSPSLSATPTEASACHTWDIWGSTAFESARYIHYRVDQSCGENYPVSDLHGWGFYAGSTTYHCNEEGPAYTLECETSHWVDCPEDGGDLRYVGSATAAGASPGSHDDWGYLECDSEQEW